MESFLSTGKTVKSVTVFVSDFGRKAMDEEAKFGPRSIWKESSQPADHDDSVSDSGSDRDSEADEDDDNEDDDIYDFIQDEEDEEDDSNSNGGDGDNKPAIEKGKSHRSSGKGEFKRVGQRDRAVGLVFHQDLVRLGKTRLDNDNDNNSVSNSVASQETGQVVAGGGLDEQALREYELRKLKYYFAIAECDTIETAAALYDQLDGAELEHSSMALDLSFVPEDVSFDGREVRDRSRGGDGSSAASLAGYKPPDFVVEALQHSKVKCSWDKGDTERERKLTNFSHWRDLNESELQQYIASSSDESDSEEVAVAESHTGKATKKQTQLQLRAAEEARKKLKATSKKAKAEQLRRQLLGLQDDDGDRDGEERDDFFGSEADDNDEQGDDDSGEVHEMSYMPEDSGEEDGSGSIGSDQDRNTTFKTKGKKKNRRSKEESDDDGNPNPNPFPAKVEDEDTRRKREAQLELLFEGEENGDIRDFNMRDILHTQKEKDKKNGKRSLRGSSSENKDGDKDENAPSKKKSKKSKKIREETASGGDSFQLDLSDSRFQPLFEDPKFGIDITQPEFKSTAVMKDVLQEQTKRKRRQQLDGSKPQTQKRERNTASSYGSSIDEASPRSSEIDVSTLVSKLKRKLQATN